MPCAGSANGYCVVTSETKQTPDGQEWKLAPATDIVAQAQMAEDAALSAQADKSAQELGQKLFESGCGE
ncbi:hypothetical protein [Pseudomonas sp. KNUC1026]|uniref:hypothetical protein n=1 Tax=Pseudomonas sp. KNUC1026 TaxID=2893890 RepID=UPI001F3D9667|nr:hypothetical protein [Pseudomonas sp. KNUC1026]UFH49297.1 hypothetical protein LN139_20905 [Pseudomonas sp. KNUC1026]